MKASTIRVGLGRAFARVGDAPELHQVVEVAAVKLKELNADFTLRLDYPRPADQLMRAPAKNFPKNLVPCALLLSTRSNAVSIPVSATMWAVTFGASPLNSQPVVVPGETPGGRDRVLDFITEVSAKFFGETASEEVAP